LPRPPALARERTWSTRRVNAEAPLVYGWFCAFAPLAHSAGRSCRRPTSAGRVPPARRVREPPRTPLKPLLHTRLPRAGVRPLLRNNNRQFSPAPTSGTAVSALSPAVGFFHHQAPPGGMCQGPTRRERLTLPAPFPPRPGRPFRPGTGLGVVRAFTAARNCAPRFREDDDPPAGQPNRRVCDDKNRRPGGTRMFAPESPTLSCG